MNFRVWDKELGIYRTDIALYSDGKIKFINSNDNEIQDQSNFILEFGFKPKYINKIFYEGDVVRLCGEYRKGVFLIKFFATQFVFVDKNLYPIEQYDSGSEEFDSLENIDFETEVEYIGNINQNPSLIKEIGFKHQLDTWAE